MMRGKCRGFTLIELLVTILAIVFLVAIFWPFGCMGHEKYQAAMVSTVSNGLNIYQSYYANQMDTLAVGKDVTGWPKSGEFRTSTEFFIQRVTSGIMTVSYDFFSAPGIPPTKSMDAEDFKAENNAWRLVLGLDEQPEGTPFLFTRNYDPGHGVGPDGKIKLSGEPFGSRGLVVVAKGGSAYILKGKRLNLRIFNPPGSNLTVVGP